MQLFYMDESGTTGSPLFVVGGVTFSASALETITRKFLNVKADVHADGRRLKHAHDYEREFSPEIKGRDLRTIFRDHPGPGSDLAVEVLERTLSILELHDAKIIGIVRKRANGANAIEREYERAASRVCKAFHARLTELDATGILIADNRDPSQNRIVAHEIYGEKFRGTDRLPRLIEAPTFGQSENHAGLQIADLVVSALLAPIALNEEPTSSRFGARVKKLTREVHVV